MIKPDSPFLLTRRRPWLAWPLGWAVLLVIQFLCALFFLWNIMTSVFGIQSPLISWQVYEILEIGAAASLTLGVIVTAGLLRRSLHRMHAAEQRLRMASIAFTKAIDERMVGWDLTPAERDVAVFCIKGFSIAEIADLRNTSQGTVKAQTSAVYRKAGVANRTQLLSLFIEDLFDDSLIPSNDFYSR